MNLPVVASWLNFDFAPPVSLRSFAHATKLFKDREMSQKVRIIGVPMDLGQSRRGVDMGPSALRSAGLQAAIKKLGVTVEDIGNMEVKQPEEMSIGEKRAKYLQEIAETCGDIAKTVDKCLVEGFLPLVLGGDHSIAAGVAAAVARNGTAGEVTVISC